MDVAKPKSDGGVRRRGMGERGQWRELLSRCMVSRAREACTCTHSRHRADCAEVSRGGGSEKKEGRRGQIGQWCGCLRSGEW